LEYTLRRAVEAEDNVALATSARVVGLLAGSGRGGGPARVGGVRTSDGRQIRAGLVVDALGRTSPLGSWLTALGARPMRERRSECGLLYYSRPGRKIPARGLSPLTTQSVRTPLPASTQYQPRTATGCGSGEENRSTYASPATASPCSSG
jgi:2-polyprenyl-6-methoxyphenol hydroxylase-like FAD-dependent oxidoreductase